MPGTSRVVDVPVSPDTERSRRLIANAHQHWMAGASHPVFTHHGPTSTQVDRQGLSLNDLERARQQARANNPQVEVYGEPFLHRVQQNARRLEVERAMPLIVNAPSMRGESLRQQRTFTGRFPTPGALSPRRYIDMEGSMNEDLAGIDYASVEQSMMAASRVTLREAHTSLEDPNILEFCRKCRLSTHNCDCLECQPLRISRVEMRQLRDPEVIFNT